ncbi:MAG: hypothetical protein GC191_03830 [Azospirillum sp.]|nr:hypothetical protein [Azospirillum sp.]
MTLLLRRRGLLPGLALLSLGTVLAGCTSILEQPAPDKRSYLIAAERGQRLAPPARGPVLAVRSFAISPNYEGQGLVVRRAAPAIESDFYNQLFIPPAAMVEGAASGWLRDSGLFVTVGAGSGDLPPSHLLEGTVSALYGDYADPAAAKAVIDLQLLLLDIRPNALSSVAARGDYHRAVPLAAPTATALVAGWSAALHDILGDFEDKVRAAVAEGRHR